jgi:hypothetical protein
LHGHRGDGRTSKRRIEPGPEIPIDQQVEAEQGCEVRETPWPGGLQLQKLQQYHRNQGDPDLYLHRVLSRPDEGFDPEVLLQGLKEQLNLPPLFIDGRDRAGGQIHEICQEGERPLLRLIPDRHLPKRDRTSIRGVRAGQANHLIGEHGTPAGHGAPGQHLIQHIGPWAGDKPRLGRGPAVIQRIVQVAAIHCDDGAWRKRELLRHADIVDVAGGHERPTGQAALVIQLEMECDGPLRSDEPGTIKHRGTQLDERHIQSPQWMLEPESPSRQRRDRLTPGQHLIEEGLVDLPRSMGIGIREGRAGGGAVARRGAPACRAPWPAPHKSREGSGRSPSDRTACSRTAPNTRIFWPPAQPGGAARRERIPRDRSKTGFAQNNWQRLP